MYSFGVLQEAFALLCDDDFSSSRIDVHSFGGRVTVQLGDRSERGDILHIRFYCVLVLHKIPFVHVRNYSHFVSLNLSSYMYHGRTSRGISYRDARRNVQDPEMTWQSINSSRTRNCHTSTRPAILGLPTCQPLFGNDGWHNRSNVPNFIDGNYVSFVFVSHVAPLVAKPRPLVTAGFGSNRPGVRREPRLQRRTYHVAHSWS